MFAASSVAYDSIPYPGSTESRGKGTGANGGAQYLATTIAGGAPTPTPVTALGASLSPWILTADGNGNVYFTSGFGLPVGDMTSAVYKLDKSGVLTRVVGSGRPYPPGDPPDGSAATSGSINANGLAVDSAGNLYVSDQQRIRKINASGVISTFAGTGEGYSGDGGPATKAGFDAPGALEFDPAGNLYVADGYRIRRIATPGTVTTVAGNGTQGYTGDGGAATNAALGAAGVALLTCDPSGNLYSIREVSRRSEKYPPAERLRRLPEYRTSTIWRNRRT